MYSEDEAGALRREQAAQQRRLEHVAGIAPARRPDKRERRKIIGFIRGKD
jgi:hypothetical protein